MTEIFICPLCATWKKTSSVPPTARIQSFSAYGSNAKKAGMLYFGGRKTRTIKICLETRRCFTAQLVWLSFPITFCALWFDILRSFSDLHKNQLIHCKYILLSTFYTRSRKFSINYSSGQSGLIFISDLMMGVSGTSLPLDHLIPAGL